MATKDTVEVIKCGTYDIEIGSLEHSSLSALLKKDFKNSKKIILVDENTLKYALPYVLNHFEALRDAEIIEISSGESSKTLDTCSQIWSALLDFNVGRSDVLINLGGGVITDLGGFVAACYKRGMKFINIPTTLLAQVDASIGSKTGVDHEHLKNVVGVYQDPVRIYMDPYFLKSLPKKHLISGFAEIIKHGLIADKRYWTKIKNTNLESIEAFFKLVKRSIQIKKKIVQKDPNEQGLRKTLNFGHTIGHAIETYALEGGGQVLLHGEAVAIGMICESFIAFKKKKITKGELQEIQEVIMVHFPKYVISDLAFVRIIELMKNDKKNTKGKINFTLLNGIGVAEVDFNAKYDKIEQSLKYYQNLVADFESIENEAPKT